MQDSTPNKHPSRGRKSVLKMFDPCYDSPTYTNDTYQNDTKENSDDCDATLVNINNTLNITNPCIQVENSKEGVTYTQDDVLNETYTDAKLNISRNSVDCDVMLNNVENSPNSTRHKYTSNCLQEQSIVDVVKMLDDLISSVLETDNSMNADSTPVKCPSRGRKSVLKLFDPCYDSPTYTNDTYEKDTKENSEDCDTTFININNTLNSTKQCIQDENRKEDIYVEGDDVLNETFHTDAKLNINRNSADYDIMLNNIENSPNSTQQMCTSNYVQEQSIVDVVEMLDDVISNVVEIDNNNSMNALADKNVELKLLLKERNDEIASLKIRLKMKEELIEKTIVQSVQYKETLKQLLGQQHEIMQLKEAVRTMKLEEEKLLERLETLNKNDISLKKLVSEYINYIRKCEAQIEIQKTECDNAKRHLAAIEIAFLDLHNKYEKSKLLIDRYKGNQEILQNSFVEANETIRANEEKYKLLKTHAKTQINKANQQLHSFQEQYDGEIQMLSTMVKRFEIKISFLANSLEQKSEECNKLTMLCNEVAKS